MPSPINYNLSWRFLSFLVKICHLKESFIMISSCCFQLYMQFFQSKIGTRIKHTENRCQETHTNIIYYRCKKENCKIVRKSKNASLRLHVKSRTHLIRSKGSITIWLYLWNVINKSLFLLYVYIPIKIEKWKCISFDDDMCSLA